MKIFANITAYNEETFLDYVLSSIHDYADEICIIDAAMENIVLRGAPRHSVDSSVQIIEKWKSKSKKIHTIRPSIPPKTFIELGNYGLNLAKELKCDWFWSVGADEIWPKNCVVPMRNFLSFCDKNNIMGINVNMYGFCPDFWHWYPFYVPRIGKITDDCFMPFKSCDILYWPNLNAWQSIELDKVPEHVKKINIDYPFKIFHYTCVGYEKIKAKCEFYKTYCDNVGAEHLQHYIDKDWNYFKDAMKCREFSGSHPEIMRKHPLYNERMY